MALEDICRDQDTAVGHTDIMGAPVTGTITKTSDKFEIEGVKAVRNGDIVYFPSHPHALCPAPCDYQDHSVPVTGTAKTYLEGEKVARDGDTVPVADSAGPDAYMIATQVKAKSNPL